MIVKKFQEGGFIDEDDLFSDDGPLEGQGDPLTGAQTVSDEYKESGNPPADIPPVPDIEVKSDIVEDVEEIEDLPPAQVLKEDAKEDVAVDIDIPAETKIELTGIERFLSDYGVQGGIIEYEDGSSAKFTDLAAEEQETVLSSLVKNASLSVEEKFNLDEDEIGLINSFRESGLEDIGEFLNNIVDSRVSSYLKQENAKNIDFDGIENDDLFILHLKDRHPDISNEQIAEELNKAKDLFTYKDTVGSIRDSYKLKQTATNEKKTSLEQAEFNNEVEMQREEVVSVVEDINDIAGAKLTDEVKEYLLHDLIELNDNNDPILMEKIFSDPGTMLKANWFLNYGEDYIGSLNDYWKRQVSAAYKNGYEKSVNGMPDNPTIIGADTRTQKGKDSRAVTQGLRFGETVSEEELFDD